MKRLLLAALLALAPLGALAQTFPGQIPPGTVLGNPTGLEAPATVFPIFATANTWTQPQNFICNNTAPIPNVSNGFVIVQNSAVTKNQIYDPNTAVTVKTFDIVQSTGFLPSGSTIGSLNGFGAYIRNEQVSAGGGGVAFYALLTCGANGASCWGENYRVVDCENVTTCAVVTNATLIAGEDDFYVGNTCGAGVVGPCAVGGVGPTTVGARSVILSSFMDRQPNFAFGWSCSNVSTIAGNNPPYWNSCLSSLNGAAAVALSIGTLKHIPVGGIPNIASQAISFTYTGPAGGFQNWQLFVDVAGTLQLISTQTSATLNIPQETAVRSFLVGASGTPVLEVGLTGTTVQFPTLTGAAGYACLDAVGTLYKAVTCP